MLQDIYTNTYRSAIILLIALGALTGCWVTHRSMHELQDEIPTMAMPTDARIFFNALQLNALLITPTSCLIDTEWAIEFTRAFKPYRVRNAPVDGCIFAEMLVTDAIIANTVACPLTHATIREHGKSMNFDLKWASSLSESMLGYVVSSSRDYTTKVVSLVRGLNYVIHSQSANFTSLESWPIVVPREVSGTNLHIHVPEINGVLDASNAFIEIFFSSIPNWNAVQPSVVAPERKSSRVYLTTRDLSRKRSRMSIYDEGIDSAPTDGNMELTKQQPAQFFDAGEPQPKRRRTGNRQMFGSNGCPIGYQKIYSSCWPNGGKPQFRQEELLTQVFMEQEGRKHLELPGIRLSIFTEIDHSAGTMKVPAVQYLMKMAVKKPKRVLVNGKGVVVNPNEQMSVKSEMNGYLEIDIPIDQDTLAPILFFRTEYMKPDHWKMIYLKDAIKRIVASKGHMKQVIPGVDEAGVKAVEMATTQILQTAMGGMPVLGRQPLNSRQRLRRRDFGDRNLDPDAVHVDHHADVNFSLTDSDTDSHKFWSLDLSNSSSPHFRSYQTPEELQLHYESTVGDQRSLHKRNFLLDAEDKIKFKTKEAVHDTTVAVSHFAGDINQFFVEKSKGNGPLSLIVRVVYNGVKKAVEFVIDTVAKAAHFCQDLFNELKIQLESVAKKIMAVFGLGDILNTARFLASHMEKMVYEIPKVLNENLKEFDGDVKNLKDKITEYFDKAKTQFGGDGNLKDWSDQSQNDLKMSQPVHSDTRSRYIQHRLASSLDPNSKANTVGTDNNLQQDRNIVDPESMNSITNDLDTYIKPEERESFKKQVSVRMDKTFSNGIAGVTMSTLVNFLEDIIFLALDSVVKIKTFITQLLERIFVNFDRILKERLRIPFLTTFFENTMTRGQGVFNLYNLFALMGAFSATTSYKLIHKKAPLSTAEVDALQKTEDINQYVKSLARVRGGTMKDSANILSVVLGSLFVTVHAMYAAVSLFNQLTIWPIRWIQGYFLGAMQYILQISSVPLNWELEAHSPSFAMRTRIWFFALLQFMFNKGNPTLIGFFMPGMITSYMQTVLAVPKLGMLIAMLVIDMEHKMAQKEAERKVSAVLRFLGYTFYTMSQFLEGWLLIDNPGFDLKARVFDLKKYATFFIFPAYAAEQKAIAIAQDGLLWAATATHSVRLMQAMIENTPFLN